MPIGRIDQQAPEDLGGVRARFRACVEADASWRRNALIDLQFRAGTDGEKSYQWPEAAQTSRNDAGRPFLTINRIDPPLKIVENEARQANISILVVPLKGDVSEDGAEARQGLIRHVMDLSDGEVVGDMVFSDALTTGKGWARVFTAYDDDESTEQELYVEAIPDVFTVYADPAASKPDRRDMRYSFVVEDLPREEFDQLYPESQLAAGTLAIASLGTDEKLTWFPGGSVRVADYYSLIETVQMKRGQPVRRVQGVRWQKITGLEVLTETVIPIKRIPLVPEFADQFRLNGKVDYKGMVRNMRDPQRLFNFTATSLAEQEDAAPRIQWIISSRQIDGVEQYWNDNQRRNYAVYNDTDVNGNPITTAPPERNSVPVPIQATVEALQMADLYVKETSQSFDPSLGQNKSNQSGRAVQALQAQSQTGNFNFIDNHKRFLRSLGRLILEMAAVYYDTARVRRIIGTTGQPKSVVFHTGAKFKPADDSALLDGIDGADSIHDLSVGTYDVSVTTGPNTISKRQEQTGQLLDFLKVAPQAAAISGDILAGLMELPQLKSRLQKMLPPQLQDDANQQDPEMKLQQMTQQLQMLGQQHQLLVQELNAKTQFIEQKQAETQRDIQIAKLNNDTKVLIAGVNAQTQLTVGIAKAEGAAGIAELKARVEHVTTLMEQAHDFAMTSQQQQHELGMAQVAGQQQSDLSAQGASQQGDLQAQGADQQLAAQAQQAASQPEAGNGAGA